MTFGSLFRDPIWLVPLTEKGSNISVSVMDVFPGNQWDRSSHKVFWGSRDDSSSLTPEIPITAGVAHIRLELPMKESGFGIEGQRTAVVMFGLVPKSTKRILTTSVPWCYLINGSGSPSLEQLFASQIAAEDGQPRTSLNLDHGFVLNAAIKRTAISQRVYCLLRIWVAEPGTRREATAALDPIGGKT